MSGLLDSGIIPDSDQGFDGAAAPSPPTGPAGGDLSGTYPNPEVAAVTTTTGPTQLVIGAVADGEFLKRSGGTLIGGIPPDLDVMVSISAADTTPGYLDGKVTVDAGKLTTAITSPAGDERLNFGIGADVFDKTTDDTDDITEGAAKFNVTHTGDVTGATALTIGANKVLNSMLAQMAAATFKGNNTGGLSDPLDLTAAQMKTALAYLQAVDIDTLAELNAIVTDATLDDSGDSRPPNGSAGGDLTGTYPNPTIQAITPSAETTNMTRSVGGHTILQINAGNAGSRADLVLRNSATKLTAHRQDNGNSLVEFGTAVPAYIINSQKGNTDVIIHGDTVDNLIYVDAANSNVGIGTATPDASAALDVTGQVKITGGTPGANKLLTSDAAGLATWETPDFLVAADIDTFAELNAIVTDETLGGLGHIQTWSAVNTFSAAKMIFTDAGFQFATAGNVNFMRDVPGKSKIVLTANGAFVAELVMQYGSDVNATYDVVQQSTSTQIDYGTSVANVYQNTAKNDVNFVFRGSTDNNLLFTDAGLDAVGVGTATPAAKLHVDQASATGAKPVIYLDQADLSEEMIEFNTTIGTGNAIEAIGAKTLTTTHFIKVTLPGALTRYIPVGTIA